MSKIISNRWKPFLNLLILPNQGGFVVGRQIWDNFIQVQQAIHSGFSRGEVGMVIKLDMANTFDIVNHDFLKEVIEKFIFDQTLLVVELDYLQDSEVFCFQRVYVYTPQKYVHSSMWGSAEGAYPLCGVRGQRPSMGVRGRSPRRKNCLVNVYCNFIVNLDHSL
jgi:hypothetical protein